MIVKFAEATNRKTKCFWLTVFDIEILISYETPVAFRTRSGVARFRQKNHWGPTTGRHMKETNVYDWPVIAESADFIAALDRAIASCIARDKDLIAAIVAEKTVPTEEPA